TDAWRNSLDHYQEFVIIVALDLKIEAELSFSFVALTMKPGIASVIVRINVGRVKLISFEKNVPLQMNNLVVLRGVCNRLHNKCTPK
ncbi:hypothetical protein, partial [Lacticaseibacillus sp. 53-4]|uniref:hypothetical protein n=1 Tax=Lacticaseibacillus sp. 53-4 TaxID=2799575 RepID=UPI001944D989